MSRPKGVWILYGARGGIRTHMSRRTAGFRPAAAAWFRHPGRETIRRSLMRSSHGKRLPFLSDRYETVTVTVSMYTVFDGCCPAGPALGSSTGILAIRLTTPSPFTIRPKIV